MIRVERVDGGFRASVSPPEGEAWSSGVLGSMTEVLEALAATGLHQRDVREGLDASSPGWSAVHDAELHAARTQVGQSRRGRPPYVQSVDGGAVVVDRGWWRSRRRARDDIELATQLQRLRDQGVPFLDGPSGWPPAAVFAHLAEAGLVEGRCTTIVFEGDGRWVVRPGGRSLPGG
ncbi:MAG: hypothetical protein U0P45_04170 [Acidimicrobiales bacterium]